MKQSGVLGTCAVIILYGSVAFAQGSPAAMPGPKAAVDHAGAAPHAGAGGQAMPSTAKVNEQMKKMQALHGQMMSAKTPEERQKLMEEARAEMQAGMTMMQPMMQNGGMMGKRVDMMQMMMQMMMDQQGVMAGPAGAASMPAK